MMYKGLILIKIILFIANPVWSIAADQDWQVDQQLDLALGALERPVWQPILLPGVEKQRGMPRWSIYRQVSPAAQLDFRSSELFNESLERRRFSEGGSNKIQSNEGGGSVLISIGGSSEANQPSQDGQTPNQKSQPQIPQIDPPEIEPPEIPGPSLPGF